MAGWSVIVLLSVFSMLRKGLGNEAWPDSGYTLALNIVAFSAALWMWMEMKKGGSETVPTGVDEDRPC